MSNAGPLTGSLISIAESCRSILSLTTRPNWSSVDEHVTQLTFFPELLTSFDS